MMPTASLSLMMTIINTKCQLSIHAHHVMIFSFNYNTGKEKVGEKEEKEERE